MDKKTENWTTAGLLDHIVAINKRMKDRAFAFIIGAGASKPSGIRTGSELVQVWLNELRLRLDHTRDEQPIETWATKENLGIDGFHYDAAPSFYPQVFERRFSDDLQEGHAYLEAEMEDKEPSFGYSILAQILEKTRHRVVITTNFDNLVADAMGTYTRIHPQVVGHESLSEYVRPRLRRPLVVKIHRDLFFSPQNKTDEVGQLAEGLEEPLTRIFEHYTPIVIGYGGNDGSLMGLLEKLPKETMSGGIFWCYREGQPLPVGRIAEVVNRHKGKFVSILGFDEFMLQLDS